MNRKDTKYIDIRSMLSYRMTIEREDRYKVHYTHFFVKIIYRCETAWKWVAGSFTVAMKSV